jgi:short subunit dehydrogenase-like uncharacterized protein
LLEVENTYSRIFEATNVTDRILLYGSYGYTGRLITERAVADGLDPIVAGRTASKVESQAVEHDLDHRVFSLANPEIVADAIEDAAVVLNCAGPFAETSAPLVDACLETGTHYLDITGEIGVFESIAERDAAAENAGVTLMPGVGFDVVPTDCLAVHLHDRLPDATHLDLGFQGIDVLSPGTAHTVVSSLGTGGCVRRNGALQRVPNAHDVTTIDFGAGPTTAVSIPWGDVSTAYYSTGIPNVTVYTRLSDRTIQGMKLLDRLDWLVGSGPVQTLLHGLIDRFVDGPTPAHRRETTTYVWGRATNGDETVVSRLQLPESYAFTSRSAPALAARVRDGEAPTGFQTPASAFDKDVVLDVADVERVDE